MISLALAIFGAARGNDRIRIRVDNDWKFRLEPRREGHSKTHLAWQWRPAAATSIELAALPIDIEGGTWKPVAIGQDVFQQKPGFAWFRTSLGGDPSDRMRRLRFESIDDSAAVFLNGHRLIVHEGWNDPFEVSLREAWNSAGSNELVVLNQNTYGPGGLLGPVTFVDASDPNSSPRQSQPGFDDRGWRSVHLPHDFVVEGKIDQGADPGHGALPTGRGWYRKAFVVPANLKGRSAWIDFDGVYRDATVWLNGRRLGGHACGYGSFRFDISGTVNFGGRNELAVHVDATRSEGWWYEGGGIYRHVWLNFANPLHVRPWGTYVTSSVAGRQATVSIQTSLDNDSARTTRVSVRSTILDPQGRVIATTTSGPRSVAHVNGMDTQRAANLAVAANTAGLSAPSLVAQTVNLARPKLWSIESPNLYTLRTEVLEGDRPIDEVRTTFGVRTIRFDPKEGFFLNGKRVEINGTCNHQDHAGVGVAVPDGLFRWRIAQLKKMGSNAYRCAHNPPAQELLDECDRQGMIVMDETRHLGDTEQPKSSPTVPATDLLELKAMVLRDRNHPSIVMWSMCNEEGIQGSDAGAKIFRAMMDTTRALDGTRPVTSAMNGGFGQGISLVEDLQGINYYPEVYDDLHARFPNRPAFGSETGSAVADRGIYASDASRGYVSSYDEWSADWNAEVRWKPIGRRKWMAGSFVWTGFDYKGEPTPYGWPSVSSHFGIMDACGFPKDIYYYYRSWWQEKPVVHILPHWNWSQPSGKPIRVWCYSNADSVELFLNGVSLGSKEMPPLGHLEWAVNYKPGTLVAKGYRGGRLIATDRVETTGEPYALRLHTDVAQVPADGEEITEIRAEVVDEKGRVVPTAGNLVSFSVEGPGSVVGVGNGDPNSHELDKASQRHAFNGLCMALVGAATRTGTATVVAYSPGLRPARLTLSYVQGRWR